MEPVVTLQSFIRRVAGGQYTVREPDRQIFERTARSWLGLTTGYYRHKDLSELPVESVKVMPTHSRLSVIAPSQLPNCIPIVTNCFFSVRSEWLGRKRNRSGGSKKAWGELLRFVEMGKKFSLAGSRTPLSRVTGACTNRYTTRDLLGKHVPNIII